MERRKNSVTRPSALPLDYLKMVAEIFTSHFDTGLKILEKFQPHSQFEVSGGVFSDEVVVSVSLGNAERIVATTVHASADFDPKASAPTVQDLLSACVDAIGLIFNGLLVPEKLEIIAQLAEDSLEGLENIPFDWTPVESNEKQIFIKLDKSNPKIDHLADSWLSEHDPEHKNRETAEEKETENLFFTGPKNKQGSGIPY